MKRSLFWLLGLGVAPGAVYAFDPLHRVHVDRALRLQAWSDYKIEHPFVSELDVRREVNVFSSNSGHNTVLAVPSKVVSAYDSTSTAHDLTPFYAAQNIRTHFILNYFVPGTTLLVSWGYDSGSKAQKISLSPTTFLGLSSYKRINSSSALFFTMGGWQKQRITETPCVDSYDRQYWCANLSAWSDHSPLTAPVFRFVDIKYELKF